jgi:hypothetical protein
MAESNAPSRKVAVGLLAGAVMTILAWVSKTYTGIEIPAEVALAGSTVITFAIQYFVVDKETTNAPETNVPPAAPPAPG